MPDPKLLRIPVGQTGGFGLALVNRGAVGYLATWQAPAGKVFPAVAQADYAAGSTTWQCQLTSAAVTSSANVDEADRAGTFCTAPGRTVTVAEDTFQLEITAFQDAQDKDGLQAFLYENRRQEAFFYLSCDGPNGAPRAIGRVYLTSSTLGGEAWTDLSADVVLPLVRAADVEFGAGATTRIVLGSTPPKSMAAPGSVYPAEPTVTASDVTNAAKLAGLGYVAVPQTNWTVGQKITIGTFDFHHNGTIWVAGAHP